MQKLYLIKERKTFFGSTLIKKSLIIFLSHKNHNTVIIILKKLNQNLKIKPLIIIRILNKKNKKIRNMKDIKICLKQNNNKNYNIKNYYYYNKRFKKRKVKKKKRKSPRK